jgi:hypothetical protein
MASAEAWKSVMHTLREPAEDGSWGPPRTPAMVAKLTDYVWTIQEWLLQPADLHEDARPVSSLPGGLQNDRKQV